MSRFLDDRERAAEGIFVREEELRFLAVRRGIQSLGSWAAAAMELEQDAAQSYADGLIGAFVAGEHEADLVERVQTDLERAGKPALSTTVGATLSQAIAEATQDLRGKTTPSAGKVDDALETWPERHKARQHWSLS